MDWYEFMLWIVIGSIMLQLGKWLQRREDKRKKEAELTYQWTCAYPQCDFHVEASSSDFVEMISTHHNSYIHGL